MTAPEAFQKSRSDSWLRDRPAWVGASAGPAEEISAEAEEGEAEAEVGHFHSFADVEIHEDWKGLYG